MTTTTQTPTTIKTGLALAILSATCTNGDEVFKGVPEFDADDRISTGYDADLVRDATFRATVKTPFTLDDLSSTIDSAADSLAMRVIEEHVPGFSSERPTGSLHGDVNCVSADSGGIVITFALSIDADLKRA